MADFASGVEELIGAINGLRMALTGESERELLEEEAYREDMRRNRDEIVGNTEATSENTKQKKLSTLAFQQLKNVVKAAKDEFFNIGNAGFKLAETLGTGATKGVQLELDLRASQVGQLKRFNTDTVATMDQVVAGINAFTDQFTGAAAGMQISAEGATQFARDLKTGFGSEFKAQGDTLRIMTEMGISNVEQMAAFRGATGRAGLSAGQLSRLYNQNRLSFLLYGNSFAKAAVQAERLGINLASIQGAQEGLVTNLDGTIDTVAQLNQLGAQLDFGTLIKVAEQDGPDALLAYVRRTVPEQLMQSSSTRALFKQLGISVEDYMKAGAKQVSAADQIEKKFTETAVNAGGLAQTIATVTRVDNVLTDALGELWKATKNAAMALLEWIANLKAAGLANLLKTLIPGGGSTSLLNTVGSKIPLPGGLTMASSVGASAAATSAVVVGGLAAGLAIGDQFNTSLAEGGSGTLGDWWRYQGSGIFGKSNAEEEAEAAAEADKLARARNAGFNSWDEMVAANRARAQQQQQRANDLMSSPGYGSRTLVTPTATYALNNNDTVMAGTNLFKADDVMSFGEGSLSMFRRPTDNSREINNLAKKVDTLIDAIKSANTVISINNVTQQTVPRLNLVQVHSRNEVR